MSNFVWCNYVFNDNLLYFTGSVHYSRMFAILQQSLITKIRRIPCATYNFLREPGKFICTYDILCLRSCKSYSFCKYNLLRKSAEKYAVSDLLKQIFSSKMLPEKSWNFKNVIVVCGTYDLLGEPGKFMCTNGILFFEFHKYYWFF